MRHDTTHFRHRIPDSAKRATAAVLVLSSAMVCACSDDPAETITHPTEHVEAKTSLARERWLEADESTQPEVWLASRIKGKAVEPRSPEVERIEGLLHTTAGQFRESPRMIANRAVQLEGMLAEIRAPESAIEIIEELSRVVGEKKHDEGFGSLCQHYFNLRAAGHNRDQALADLKLRYGAQQ